MLYSLLFFSNCPIQNFAGTLAVLTEILKWLFSLSPDKYCHSTTSSRQLLSKSHFMIRQTFRLRRYVDLALLIRFLQ